MLAALTAANLGVPMVCELALMLLFGGTDTTIAAIGHALRHLTEFPADRRRLIADATLITAAVEELLRLYSPSTGVARTVVAPTDTSALVAIGRIDREQHARPIPQPWRSLQTMSR